MSSALAISAVTTTLRNLLSRLSTSTLVGLDVTAMPPNKARKSNTTSQLNLFLYHVEESGAWRNRDLPTGTHPATHGTPPLPLDLYYMLTAYGKGDNESDAHKVLGHAMRMLYDHPVLDPADLRSASGGSFEQVEHVRVRHFDMGLEDKSKLWSTFQTDYRLTVAYQVSVALIRSDRADPAALPILRPELGVGGTMVRPTRTPCIEKITIPGGRNVALLGDTIQVHGLALEGAVVEARFSNQRLSAPIVVARQTGPAVDVQAPGFRVPTDGTGGWIAGAYTMVVEVTDAAGKKRASNPWPLMVAPDITAISPNPAVYGGSDTVAITFTAKPDFQPVQDVSLLIAGSQVGVTSLSAASAIVTFQLERESIPAGKYWVRLRVDGVDTPIVDRSVDPPTFLAARELEVK